jgi:hypothetical protein
MLDEYKTPDNFWAEAINTACHAINRLYLHKLYKKTSYELLTGNKPKVSYFRVFGCKCFILNKNPRSSKFAPKIDEGFLLGYGPNEHAYRVFSNSSGRIEITVDVTFDESNGSQVEQVDLDVVGKEKPPCEAIKRLAIGNVRPVEANEEDEPQVQASTPIQGPTPISGPADLQDAEAPHQNAEAPRSGTIISKRMIKYKLMSLKLMMLMKTNPYINLPTCHLTQEFIKVFNGIIPLTTSLGA